MARRDQRSPEAERYRKLYNTRRWRSVRKAQLTKQPLCERCLAKGRVVTATVCHHEEPDSKASADTFYAGPFQSLCAPCHDKDAKIEEQGGTVRQEDADGWVIDARYHATSPGRG